MVLKAKTKETLALSVVIVAFLGFSIWASILSQENKKIEAEYKVYCDRIGKALEASGQLGTTLVYNSDRMLTCVVAVPFDVPKKSEDQPCPMQG